MKKTKFKPFSKLQVGDVVKVLVERYPFGLDTYGTIDSFDNEVPDRPIRLRTPEGYLQWFSKREIEFLYR